MPVHLQDTFRANLRRRLRELGMNQRELAKLLDVSDPYVSQLLNGDNAPTLETVEKIARALGTTNFYLLLPVETAETVDLNVESHVSHGRG